MRPFLRTPALAIAALLVGAADPALAAARFEVLKSFEFPVGADAGLVAGPGGAIYGTTVFGGPANLGTVFRVDGDGVFRRLHAFDGADGSYPEGLIVGSDGALYGTAEGRPSTGRRIFRIDADGSFSQVHAFPGPDCCGVSVQLAIGSDGALVGTTYDGRARTGTIFRIDGGGGAVTLHSFGDISGLTRLVLGGDGALYGTVFTRFDGYTFFEVDAAGTFTPLASFHHFDPNPGWNPILLASDGNFYGTTPQFSGTRPATLFRIDGDGRLTVLHEFGPNVTIPSGGMPLVEGQDGAIYGAGGLTIFRFDRAGKFSELRTFGWEDAYPSPLVLGSDGRLYGTTARVFYAITGAGDFEALHTFTQAPPPDGLVLGGDGSFYGRIGDAYTISLDSHGILFKIDRAGTFTPVHSFHAADGFYPSSQALTRGAGGALYGVTSEGGLSDSGVLFGVDPSGDFTTLRDLPVGSEVLPLIADAAGIVYGALRELESGGGELFRIELSGAIETIHRFDPGSEPSGLMLGRDGRVYGTAGYEIFRIAADGSFASIHTVDGGATLMASRADGTLYGVAGGAAFELRATGGFTLLLHASEVGRDCSSGFPAGSSFSRLALGGDGVLYALHALTCDIGEGGSYSEAQLLAINGVGAFRRLRSFGAGASPSFPIGVGSDGSLYGAVSSGAGSIFRVDAAGDFRLVHAFDGATGSWPPDHLTPGGDGALYGVTGAGGAEHAGTLFRIAAAGSFHLLHSFAAGETPIGSLVLGGDGALYGLGRGDAARQGGGVFRFSARDGYRLLHVFSGPDGSLPVPPLAVGDGGSLYGTTWRGGTSDAGVVYRLAFRPDCGDGIDNDGDGRIDLGGDPHCASEDDPNENAAPVARCRDVTLATDAAACGATAAIDGGSSDADGHALGSEQSPAGPYEPGTTEVALRVIDPFGEEDSCSAEVTVVDETAPAIDCGPVAVSRRGRSAGPSWSATDACGAVVASATVPECFVVKKNGRRVERGCDGLTLNAPGPVDLPKSKTHVTWTVSARDATGNQANRSCETVIGKPQR
jgi:uncharacterized repeat protein (TIGR03803 family)